MSRRRHGADGLDEAGPVTDAPAVLQDVSGPLIGIKIASGRGLSDSVHPIGQAPALAAENELPAVVDGAQIRAHGHGPLLQIRIPRQGLVLRHGSGAGLGDPLDALAEQLRDISGGDHGPAVYYLGKVLRVDPVAVQRHLGPAGGQGCFGLFRVDPGGHFGPLGLCHRLECRAVPELIHGITGTLQKLLEFQSGEGHAGTRPAFQPPCPQIPQR